MISGIYQIKNQVNGNCYIGSAVNLKKRWRQHLSALRRKDHHNSHLQAAFAKYGEVIFVFEILEYATPEALIEREQHYLDSLEPEYNVLPAAGSPLGCRLTEEHKRKISEALKGKHVSDETRRKYSEMQRGERNHNYGRPLSKEHRRKISEALKGKPRSEETKRKISEACMGRRHTEETRRKISGKRNHNYGKQASEETRLKLSLALKAYWRRVHAARPQLEGS